jgi:tetratricopeptide (TPR) repeat protein
MLFRTPNRSAAVMAVVLTVFGLAGCGGAESRKARHLEKGQNYLTAGNFDKARVEFQNALQIAPADPETRFEMGVVDEKLGKIREAAQFYQGVIDVSPEHLGARTNLARLYVFSAAPNRALELIGPSLEKHPDDSELLTLRAAVRVQQKDLADGQTDAERAVHLNPVNEDAVATLAGIYISLKDNEKAQALLEESIKRIPATVDLRVALTQVYAREDRAADIERILLDLVRLRPAERAQRIRLSQFYSSQNQLDAAEHVLREGINALPQDRDLKLALIDFMGSRRSQQAAEKELTAMVAADPKDAEMKFALAKFYERNSQPDRAEGIYQQVIDAEKLDAAGLSARDRLAVLRGERNDTAGAEKLIAEVLAKSPRDENALILRGNIALSKKDPKAAIADLRTVLRDQPNAVGVLRTLARAHLINGEPAIAEETMRRAVESNPKDVSLRLDLAQLLAQLGKPDQAKPILVGIVKDQPNDVPALDTLFKVSASMKDYDTARSSADAIVASQPKASMGYLYQGMIAEAERHIDAAVRLYGQAADLQPDSLEPLQAQIRVLVAEKRLPEAMKRLDEVTARVPTGALAPSVKGNLLLGQGAAAEAQAAYRMAIARAPTWWVPYTGLANAQFAAKEPDAALATLRSGQAVVSQPDQLGISIGEYYERSGKIEDAIREYEAVVRKDPQSEVAANNLAMLLVTHKSDSASLDRAKALSERFADSANPSFLDTYAWVLYKRGQAAASVPLFERVVAKVPGEPVALYHLGMAQSQAGSRTEARGNLTRAVNSGAKFAGLDEAKATLDKLAKLSADATPKT